MVNQTIIGKFIAIKRKEKNLTQEQLAEKIGVSNKSVSKWECGKAVKNSEFGKTKGITSRNCSYCYGYCITCIIPSIWRFKF